MLGLSSPWHLLFVAIAVAVVFGGKGKLSGIMGDAAKGIRAFKDGLKGDEETQASPPPAAAAPGVLTSDAAARARAERETSIPRAEL